MFLHFSQQKGFETFDHPAAAFNGDESDEKWLSRLGYTEICWVVGDVVTADGAQVWKRPETHIHLLPDYVAVVMISDKGEYVFCDNRADLFALQLKFESISVHWYLTDIVDKLDTLLRKIR